MNHVEPDTNTTTPVIIWKNKYIKRNHKCRCRCPTRTRLFSKVSVLQKLCCVVPGEKNKCILMYYEVMFSSINHLFHFLTDAYTLGGWFLPTYCWWRGTDVCYRGLFQLVRSTLWSVPYRVVEKGCSMVWNNYLVMWILISFKGIFNRARFWSTMASNVTNPMLSNIGYGSAQADYGGGFFDNRHG